MTVRTINLFIERKVHFFNSFCCMGCFCVRGWIHYSVFVKRLLTDTFRQVSTIWTFKFIEFLGKLNVSSSAAAFTYLSIDRHSGLVVKASAS